MGEAPDRVLLVDDDPELGALVAEELRLFGFDCRHVPSLAAAEAALASEAAPDLILLDVALGDGNGVDWCRRLRPGWSGPVIMLTARAETIDRILGIEAGADDYLAKPFHPRELVARMRAVLRRARGGGGEASASRVLCFAGWRLDLVRRELRRADGSLLALSDGEFDILALLAERARRVVSRDEIFQALHGRLPDPEDRSIDLRISRLRRKIEPDPRQPSLIKTVRASGFLFSEIVLPAEA